MHSNRPLGFTLVELMVVLVILGVLLAVGVPSFQNSMASNRTATAANELNAALSLARSEALRSTRQAVVCPTNDGTACVNSDWNRGWLVALDSNSDDTEDTPVRFIQAKDRVQLTVTGIPAAYANKLVIDSRGRPKSNGTIVNLQLTPVGCTSGKPFRSTLFMNMSGQVRLEKGQCT